MTTIYRYSEHKPKPFEVVNTLKNLQQALEPEGLSPALDDHQLCSWLANSTPKASAEARSQPLDISSTAP